MVARFCVGDVGKLKRSYKGEGGCQQNRDFGAPADFLPGMHSSFVDQRSSYRYSCLSSIIMMRVVNLKPGRGNSLVRVHHRNTSLSGLAGSPARPGRP